MPTRLNKRSSNTRLTASPLEATSSRNWMNRMTTLVLTAREGALPPAFLHHLGKSLKQVRRVVRAGRRLRVILHAEEWQRFVAQAFERLVVQVHVGERDFARLERIRIDSETVVLRRDFHLLRFQIQHRMVPAVVAELQLVGAAAEREADDLVAEADAEDGDAAHEIAHGLGCVLDWLGIARAVREKHTVGFQSENVARRSHRRDRSEEHTSELQSPSVI